MNYAWYIFARALAVVLVAFFLMAVMSVGVGLHERLGRLALERLGAAISDGGHCDVDFWYWPPQLRLSGRYHGVPFHFEKVNRQFSHLLVDCIPESSWETSIHRLPPLPAGITYDRIHESFPGWISLMASRHDVPWTKRSLDRRPLGLGSAPGIDLYRKSRPADDPQVVLSNLSGLASFCTDRP